MTSTMTFEDKRNAHARLQQEQAYAEAKAAHWAKKSDLPDLAATCQLMSAHSYRLARLIMGIDE